MSSNEQNKNRADGQGRPQGGGRPRRKNNGYRQGGNSRSGSRYRNGGNGSVRFSKMPRRKPKPSLWQRLLNFLGLGSKPKPKPGRSKPEAKNAQSKQPGGKKAREPRKKRTPEHVQVTSSRLYVGNLSYDATESELTELFSGVGLVSSAEVVLHSRTQRSKGFAFVEMTSMEEALRAVQELHDKDYMGRKLVVSGAKKPRSRDID